MTVTSRGHRGPGLGHTPFISPPPEWRGPTSQLCGLYMPGVGGASPNIGVPLGKGLVSRRTVCGDPISWFTRAGLIAQPSWTILGKPALGKSTLVRRLVTGLAPTATPLILGDIKGEYVELVRALGGQVVTLGRGRGSLNVLEVGAMDEAADRIGGQQGLALKEEAHARRYNVLRALLAIVRGRPTEDHEDIILSAALRFLYDRWTSTKTTPLLKHLIFFSNSPVLFWRFPKSEPIRWSQRRRAYFNNQYIAPKSDWKLTYNSRMEPVHTA